MQGIGWMIPRKLSKCKAEREPAAEAAATRGTKPTCVGSPPRSVAVLALGWGESPQGDLVPFVAAASAAGSRHRD
jgi:hypothetical protein